MTYGNSWGNTMLNMLRLYPDGSARTLYLALHSSDPGPADQTSSELSGGSYARKQVLFTPPESKMMVNAQPVAWTGLMATTVNYVALWDSITGGHICVYGPITAIPISNGGAITLLNGDFTVSV